MWRGHDARTTCRGAIPAIALVCVVACGAWPASAGDPPRGFSGPVRGITLSTHLDGRDWGWDSLRPSLQDIRATGAGWVAIHPYASIGADGSVRFGELDASAPPEHLARPIREAHALGLKILIKPHLAYWGSPFRWRGEIDFTDAARWNRFWTDYERWIVALAAATRGADGFVVGTELVHTLGHEPRWRGLIAALRDVTDAPLTYAANWDEFERVPFWDALDAIGVQAYFPLTDEQDTSVAAIRAGWARWMKQLRRFSEVRQRPILFTELGYNHAFLAPVRPWDYRVDGEPARPVQQACLRVALEAVHAEPAVIGVFLWKWFPRPRPLGRNFQLASPSIERVIREAWAAGGAGAAATTAQD